MTGMLIAVRNGVPLQMRSAGVFLKQIRKSWAVFLKGRVIWNLIFGIWFTGEKGMRKVLSIAGSDCSGGAGILPQTLPRRLSVRIC